MAERLLFIAHRIPYPPNKGDKIRSYNILRYLASRYEVDLFFLIDDPRDLREIDTLRAMVRHCAYDVIRSRLKKAKTLFSLLGDQPLSVPYFYSRKLQESIDDSIAHQQHDHVFCFSSPTAEYLFRSAHRSALHASGPVMDLIDLDSLKWSQYAQSASWPMRLVFQREARQLLAYEKKIADFFNKVLLVSEAEKQLYLQYVQKGCAVAMSNGVDLQKFAPGQGKAITSSNPTIVFTGAMDYWPNIDGVLWFANEVLPLVRRDTPRVRFVVVGSNPASSIQALANREKSIEITGFVNDVRDYIAVADLCVVPLRVARGVQNKVLEAMAMGKAVVCSPEALEGINARSGQDLVVAGNAAEFAAQVTRLLSDHELRGVLARNARSCMEQRYAWENNLLCLDSLFGQKK